MLASGSNRIGAIDFQSSAFEYVPRRDDDGTLDELLHSADRVEAGEPLSPDLDAALLHGSSIGGARPKALLDGTDEQWIAKFSSVSDSYPVVQAEFIAMRLAALAGIDVTAVRLERSLGRHVLLVQRFDRYRTDDGERSGWGRRAMVSALTLLGLDEMMGRYASYETLADVIRQRFDAPRDTLRELFARLIFNVLCGNTDDHARNHAAFWSGTLSLTPAYDICPQPRAGGEAGQAMRIVGTDNLSRLDVCRRAAPRFLLSDADAVGIMSGQIASIRIHWESVCDEAGLGTAERANLFGRQFLNPYAFVGSEALLH